MIVERPFTSWLRDYTDKSEIIAGLYNRSGQFDRATIDKLSREVLTDPDPVIKVMHEICKALFLDRDASESKKALLQPISLSNILGTGILSPSRENEVRARTVHRNNIIDYIKRNHPDSSIPFFIPSNTLLIKYEGSRFIFKERTTRSVLIMTDGTPNIAEAIQTATYQIPRYEPLLSLVPEKPPILENPHFHSVVTYTPLNGPTESYIGTFPLSENVLRVFDEEQAPCKVEPQDVAMLWAHISNNILTT